MSKDNNSRNNSGKKTHKLAAKKNKPSNKSRPKNKPSDRFSDRPGYKSKNTSLSKASYKQSQKDTKFVEQEWDYDFADESYDKFSDKPKYASKRTAGKKFNDKPRYTSDNRSRDNRSSNRSFDKFDDYNERNNERKNNFSGEKSGYRSYDRFDDKPRYGSNRKSSSKFGDRSARRFDDCDDNRFSDKPEYVSNKRSDNRFADNSKRRFNDRNDRRDSFWQEKSDYRFNDKPRYAATERSGNKFSDKPRRKFDDRDNSYSDFSNRPHRKYTSEKSRSAFSDNLSDKPRGKASSRPENRFKRVSNDTFDTFKDKPSRAEKGLNAKPGPVRTQTRQPKRVVKEFNPLVFIKKVEEQVTSPVYHAKHSFSDFAIEQLIKDNIAAKGYKTPTPIQDQVIPLILEGKDVIATANTGTGKTAAFLIPLVHNVVTGKTNKVLIITPTRELADQIQSELAAFKTKTGLWSSLCIGGLSINPQIEHLKNNPAFVIGTPGRLIDLEKSKSIYFSNYDAIVLDEVDRMLDMGFINDIQYIINKLPKKRHSLFFSATIPASLKSIMASFLHNPVTVSVKTRQTAENVNQEIVKVEKKNKVEKLHDLLIKPEFTRVIVFVRTKRDADKLAKNLKERGFEVATMHGDKTQAHRKKALTALKDNKVKVLLATDVVSRGIDIDDVSHVINFDLPQTYEDYIHRIGRTGRAQKVGQALTFIEQD